jgi:hypothetical protein
MPTELHTTNIWLAVTAIAVALQTLFMFAAVIVAFRMYRKIQNAVQDLETRYVAPAEARLMAMIDDVHDITARARRIDDTVRARLADFGGAADVAKSAVVSRAWPIIGIVRAVEASIRALANRAEDTERANAARTNARTTRAVS